MRTPTAESEAIATRVAEPTEAEQDASYREFARACRDLEQVCRVALPFYLRQEKEPVPFRHADYPDVDIKITRPARGQQVVQVESLDGGIPTEVPEVRVERQFVTLGRRQAKYCLSGKTVYRPTLGCEEYFSEYFGLPEVIDENDVHVLDLEPADTKAAHDLARFLARATFDKVRYQASRRTPLWQSR